MYEIIGWCDAYPKDAFPFPWKIAEFVSSGQRLDKLADMDDEVYDLISKCWPQKPQDRLTIDPIISILKSLV